MKRFGQKLSALSERFVPEPFVLALLLILATATRVLRQRSSTAR